jgi:hypothetical protein
MKKLIGIGFMIVLLSSPAHAQLGNLIKNVQNNPLLTQQNTVRDTISRFTNIKNTFIKMPMNQGKLAFITAAVPVLNEAYSLSSDILGMFQKNKTLDPAQTNTMSGLLGEVEKLITQKGSTAPLAQTQVKESNQKVQQTTQLLTNILSNEGGLFKALLQK